MKDKTSKKATKGLNIIQGKSKNVSAEKLEFVKELFIIQGMSSREVTARFIQKFNDSDRNARLYITKCRRLLNKSQVDKVELHMRTAQMRLTDLYHKAYTEGKWGECKDIQKELNKLNGLDVKRIETTNRTTETKVDMNKLLSQMSPEMVAQMVAAMNAGKQLPQPKVIDITPDEDEDEDQDDDLYFDDDADDDQDDQADEE